MQEVRKLSKIEIFQFFRITKVYVGILVKLAAKVKMVTKITVGIL